MYSRDTETRKNLTQYTVPTGTRCSLCSRFAIRREPGMYSDITRPVCWVHRDESLDMDQDEAEQMILRKGVA
jgi:hypothetical protein